MISNKHQTMKDNPRLWLIFLILLPWVLNSLRQPSSDFGIFVDTARDWVSGETRLYDAAHVYYFFLPWSLIISLPFSYIPHPYGLLIFNSLSLGLLIWSTWSLVKPVRWWVLAISLTTIYTGMYFMLGQWDVLILAGLSLGWLGVKRKNPWLVSLALVIMTTKYTNIIFPMFIMLYSIRRWSFKDLFRVASLPILILPISFFIAGWDWPFRYSRLMNTTLAIFDHYEVITLFSRTVYPTSYWRLMPPLGPIVVVCLAIIALYLVYRLLRRGKNIDAMFLSIPLNLIITPYLMLYHLIYLAPIQAQLLKMHRALGFVLYCAAIIDVLLMWFRVGLITYPIVALIVFCSYVIIEQRKPMVDAPKPVLEIIES